MATLVPGGAIDRLAKQIGATPLTDEQSDYGGKVARAITDKGEIVWVDGEADARLLPFGEPEP